MEDTAEEGAAAMAAEEVAGAAVAPMAEVMEAAEGAAAMAAAGTTATATDERESFLSPANPSFYNVFWR